MSKVIHLSDDAHNTAKGFCKQHGLKMSDWVAALIADAIATGRVNPSQPRIVAPPPPPPPVHTTVQVHVPPQVVTPVQTHAPVAAIMVPPPPSNSPPKKKLERFREEATASNDGMPPWAAPPFWAGGKVESK